jgi:hypothetical protein
MSASALLPQARKFKSAPVQIHARRNTDDMDHQLPHISPIVVNNPLTFFKKDRKIARWGGVRLRKAQLWRDCGKEEGSIRCGKSGLQSITFTTDSQNLHRLHIALSK